MRTDVDGSSSGRIARAGRSIRAMTTAGSCAVTPGERTFRAVAGVVTGSMAFGMADNLWCAIPAGVCSFFLFVGALTGWCPPDAVRALADRLGRVTGRGAATRHATAEPNPFGIPEARNAVDRVDV